MGEIIRTSGHLQKDKSGAYSFTSSTKIEKLPCVIEQRVSGLGETAKRMFPIPLNPEGDVSQLKR